MTLILGIDDAGRGPLIGPLVIAGVLITKDHEVILKDEDVKDSKKLFQSQRVKIAKKIKENSLKTKTVKTSAMEIDDSLNSGTNLNTLEALKTAEIINTLNPITEPVKVIVDCPSINTVAWKRTLMEFIKHTGNLTVLCEHKADVNHISAAAASILAKVGREEEMDKIKKEYKKIGYVGSGYPSDPHTKKFLKEHGQELADSGIFRKTWATWKKLFPDKKQKTLGDF